MYGGLRSIEAMLLTTVHTQAPFSVRYSMNHDLSFMVSTIANHCPVVYVTHCMGELSARDVRCMSAWSWIYNYRSMVQAPVLSSRATDLNWMLTVYIFFAHRLAGEKNEKNNNKNNNKKTRGRVFKSHGSKHWYEVSCCLSVVCTSADQLLTGHISTLSQDIFGFLPFIPNGNQSVAEHLSWSY